MASRKRQRQSRPTPNTPLGRYAARSQRPLNCLAFVLSLIVVFELGGALISAEGADLLSRMQIGQFLRYLGATRWFLPPLLVVLVLLGWHAALGLKWRVSGTSLPLMAAESLLWAVPLQAIGLIAMRVTSLPGESGESLGMLGLTGPAVHSLLAGIGAGVYEEFLFRLVGLNLCTLLLLDIAELKPAWAYTAAIGVCSVLFGLYHFVGPAAFAWPAMTFYTLAGAYLSMVYMLRGFGISVGTHAAYNMLTVAVAAWGG